MFECHACLMASSNCLRTCSGLACKGALAQQIASSQQILHSHSLSAASTKVMKQKGLQCRRWYRLDMGLCMAGSPNMPLLVKLSVMYRCVA